MQLQFLGADHEVTGSCHFLKFGEKNLLVDCGMEQGPDLYVNQDIPVNPSEIDYIYRFYTAMDSGDRCLQQKQLVSCVISC